MNQLEKRIMVSFKRYEGKDVEQLDLIVSIPDTWDDEHACQVLERKDNGRVWEVECTKSGKVIYTYEL